MTGLRRQLRAAVATALAGTASVLTTAAQVAETVARELRLSLPQRPDEAPAGDGTTVDEAAVRREAAGTSTRVTYEPAGEAYADLDHSGSTEGEAPSVPLPDDTGVQSAAVSSPANTEEAEKDLTPWVDDVAASVAGGTVAQATARLHELTTPQLRAVQRYERAHQARVTLLRAIEAELAARE